MNHLYERMKSGSSKQRRAYEAIERLGILNQYRSFQPVLCGTVPIGVYVENSDLDIIMEAYHLPLLEQSFIKDYGRMERFQLQRKMIRDRKVVKVNFYYRNFMFEVFAQPQPVSEQNAYLHMIIEEELLRTIPGLREEVLVWRRKGMKTEAAFCHVLGISGDPYRGLLEYGRRLKVIE
ncbi:DUF4269 domain-containing protein [Halobacillus sp. GSS1]|uniref:DUF4269 domain-containing protein n=1 Tax=Halobacillus sp. GSS1 TaxID=2815919 RepID=UPI001F5C3D0D|nr:DUF4269 domain-containing protein [Halobacillus sp. GSS1]